MYFRLFILPSWICFQPTDYVITVHPSYVFSYAPAVVRLVYKKGANVEFYDNTRQALSYSEMYKITQEMYDRSVEYIRECEQKVVGSTAVVLNEQEGFYQKSKSKLKLLLIFLLLW